MPGEGKLLITYYIYHKLTKFEQNKMICATQNIGLFDVKPVYHVSHFLNIASTILKGLLHVEQLMLRLGLHLPLFKKKKKYGSVRLKSKFKVELNMDDLPCYFLDSPYL